MKIIRNLILIQVLLYICSRPILGDSYLTYETCRIIWVLTILFRVSRIQHFWCPFFFLFFSAF